ncbi:MAG: PH domain-containing protein [Leucobacter sp.]
MPDVSGSGVSEAGVPGGEISATGALTPDVPGADVPGTPGAPGAAQPGASDTALPGRADAEGWRRLHPLSPLLRGGLVLLVIAGIVFANFRDRLVEMFFVGGVLGGGDGSDVDISSEGGDVVDLVEYLADQGLLLVVLAAVLGAILLIVLGSWVAWRFSTYRITGEAVEARRGIVFRNHRRAPLERIQSVNLQRSLLARALGLTKIEVLTAGQGGKVELAFLGHRDAKLVREQIIRRAAAKREEKLSGRAGGSAAPFAGAQSEAAPAPAALGSNPPGSIDALEAPVSVDFAGRAYAPAGDPLMARAQDFADADIDPEAAAAHALVRVPVGRLIGSIALGWEAVITVIVLAVIVVGGAVFTPALILGVIPLLLVMASITFGQFNKGFNFTLSRGRDSVRTGSGLTSTTTESIPFGRIHAVEARQPLLWRPLGWWRVRITTAGHSVAQGGQNATQNVVLPVGAEPDVLRVVETLLPGVGDEEHEISGLRDGLTGGGVDYLRAGPRAGWVLWWGRRRAGARIVDSDSPGATLRIRRGVLTRSLSVMPVVRAQSVQLRRPLVHRLLGLASVQAHTVLGPVRMEMRGLELEAARRFFDELAATVLRVQGAEAQGTEARVLAAAVTDAVAVAGAGTAVEAGTGIPDLAETASAPALAPADVPGPVPSACAAESRDAGAAEEERR